MIPKSCESNLFFSSLLFISILSGCLAEDLGEEHEVPLTIVGQVCRGPYSASCQIVDNVMVVRGPAIDAQGAQTAIVVWNLTQPLVIQGATITNAMTAIRVNGGCGDCDVRVSDSHLTARHTGILVGDLLHVEAPLRVHRSQLVLEGDSVGRSTAIGIHASPDALVLEDVQISGTGSVGISSRDGHALQVTDTSIVGLDVGVQGRWTSLTMDGLSVACERAGVEAFYAQDVTVSRLSVSSCMPPCTEFCPAVAIGAVNAGGRNFVGDNIAVSGNHDGLYIGGFESISIQGLVLAENRRTAGGIQGQQVLIEGAVVRGNHGSGMDISAGRSAHVERAVIEENGHHLINASYPNHGLRILPGEGGMYTVRNSSFVGNRVFGFLGGNQDAVIDASGNWWGSPLGPSPPTPAGMGNPPLPGFGDMVGLGVLTEPHLTAPP